MKSLSIENVYHKSIYYIYRSSGLLFQKENFCQLDWTVRSDSDHLDPTVCICFVRLFKEEPLKTQGC